MPTTPLPDDLRALLSKPNPAVIATIGKEGQPVTAATWYLLDGDRILVNMDEGRKRNEHLRREPRIALTVLDSDGWYTAVSIQGRVVELVPDEDLTDIDRIASHYTGSPYKTRDRGRLSAYVEIDRWFGWNT